MILSGPAIHQAVERGHIAIDPFDTARLNPASYDLELGRQVACYAAEELDLRGDLAFQARSSITHKGQLDSKKRQNLVQIDMSDDGFTIEPGRLYLMHTRERICTRRFVPVLDGKSSIGRLGVLVHVTAGYGDPGFDGQYTLEVVTLAHQVVLYPGMRIAQIRFHTHSETEHERALQQPYAGNYVEAAAIGPVRSASWRQFGN